MNIIIKSHTMELTSAIREYALNKMNTLAIKDNDNIQLQVELGRTEGHRQSGDHYYCKIHTVIGSRSVHIECIKDDLYKAIDAARDKVDTELSERKDKFITKARNLSRKIKDMLKFGK